MTRGVTHLALVFPGAGYRHRDPLLYYARTVLDQIGATVVLVDYEVQPARDEIGDLGHPFFGHVRQATAVALEEHQPSHVTLTGKSLGTLAMAEIARSALVPTATALWYTPVWWDDATFEAARTCGWRSLHLVGAADPGFVPERQAQVPGDVVEIAAANHSLEIEGDVAASLDALRRVTTAVLDFVT